tara:strand:- start:209 stop:451 length:243 start_codon:yes stop_codon:yes gene_type:complete
MPSYNYKCLGCKKFFIAFQSMNDKYLTCCKFCDSNKIERLISAGSGLIFKGSGFYLTDYTNKNKKKSKARDNKKKSNKEA